MQAWAEAVGTAPCMTGRFSFVNQTAAGQIIFFGQSSDPQHRLFPLSLLAGRGRLWRPAMASPMPILASGLNRRQFMVPKQQDEHRGRGSNAELCPWARSSACKLTKIIVSEPVQGTSGSNTASRGRCCAVAAKEPRGGRIPNPKAWMRVEAIRKPWFVRRL